MNTVSLDHVRDLLQDMNLSKIAEGANVNYVTLTRFANGSVNDPGYEFIIKIQKYLHERFGTVRGE